MEPNLFLQLSALLVITVAIAFLVRLMKQPLIVAYMVAGLIGGPLFFDLLHGGENFYETFSKFGIVLLLFIVGLNLNFSYLKKIGRGSLEIGLLQFFINLALTFPLALYFGFDWLGAFFLAIAACFSSTIVVLKLLNDKHEEETVYGRYTIGLMLVQDVISIAILVILGFVSSSASSLVSFDLAFILRLVGVIIFLILASKFLLPRLLDQASQSAEFLFIFSVAWCFGVASLMLWSGFSLEAGAIIAGLSLASSKYQAEITSRVKPLRDFFLVLFFIILGSQANFEAIDRVLLPALALSIFILLVKPLILYVLFRSFYFTRRNSFLSSITSAQLSEFGFIILFAGVNLGYIKGNELGVFTLAAIITIFFSSYLIIYGSKIYNFLLPFFLIFGADRYSQKEDIKEKFEVIVFGYHRTGWKIGQALVKSGYNFAAVDFNPENVARLQEHGVRAFFGDASDIEFLKILPVIKAKIIISTIPSPEDQLVLINFVRAHNKKAIIIASLYHKKYLPTLYKAGADYVILPHLLGGGLAAELILHGGLKRRSFWQKHRKQQAKDLSHTLDYDLKTLD